VLLLCAIIIAREEEAWGDSERHPATLSAGNLSSTSRPLRTIADIPLPGTANRFDYQSYDPRRHRLFIAHLGDSTVIVFDTESRRVVKVIPGIARVHGVLAEPALGRVFATATGQNQVAIINEERLRVMTRIPGGVYPDGLAYAPPVRKLYVSDETGQAETVINVDTNRRVSSIPLGGEAGNTQFDPASEKVLVNVQSRDELIAIDPVRDVIDHRYPLPGCNTNHGLHLDPAVHLAYIACTGNDRLLVFDLDSLRVLQRHAVGRDPDVIDFDPGLRILYVASESGTVSVFRRDGRALVKLGDVRVAPHAHSIVVDTQTHFAYLPLQDVNGSPVLRVMAPAVVQ
jgi:DNA-binding beta-propeller fold protein YncE